MKMNPVVEEIHRIYKQLYDNGWVMNRSQFALEWAGKTESFLRNAEKYDAISFKTALRIANRLSDFGLQLEAGRLRRLLMQEADKD
jgi:hypothetical protein